MATLSVQYNYMIKVWNIGMGEYVLHAISDTYTEAQEWAKGLYPKAQVCDCRGNLIESFDYEELRGKAPTQTKGE